MIETSTQNSRTKGQEAIDATDAVSATRRVSVLDSLNSVRWLRLTFWAMALLFGVAQVWATRHAIFSDGISYIEIAKAYTRGDWQNAVNPYWSPLYSWLLAVAYLVLRPSAYWDVATLHLVNFIGFLLSIAGFEYFLAELLRFRNYQFGEKTGFSTPVLYLAGYCTILFAGLSMVSMWYCSPDMYAMALLLVLSGLILRIGSTGGTGRTFLAVGIVSGLSFLARTAFAPIFVVCLGICAFLKFRRREPIARMLWLIAATMLVICIPFVTAISTKSGKLTIGDSGALNYGWEVDGAARYAHWHGEPGDLGQPTHPTTLISTQPNAYAFATPIGGTYPPWYNPAYWYDGIKPKLKLRPELQVLFVNVTVLVNLFVRSAVFIAAAILLVWMGPRNWLRNMVAFWPVLVPALTVLALYCMVYLEKRYIAGNLVILWMAALTVCQLRPGVMRIWAPRLVVAICVLYTAAFVLKRQMGPVIGTASDLIHRQERDRNVQYLIADELLKAGLRAGDKIAYIGPAVDADWARIAGVKIVAEIPLVYERLHKPLNNTGFFRTDDIRGFWNATAEKRHNILEGFRKAGARILVVDGFYERPYVSRWARVLPPGMPGVPKEDPDQPSMLNTRYLWLDQAESLIEFSGRQ